MKIRLWMILFLLLSPLIALHIAALEPGDATPNGAFDWNLGPEITYVRYEEPDIMSETGVMAGLYANGRFTRRSLQCELSVSYILGDLSYHADPGPYAPRSLDLTTSGRILNLRTSAGHRFPLLDTQAVIAAGFGYRFLEDDVPDAPPLLGYLRQQTYYHLPITLTAVSPLSHGARAELDLEGSYLLRGENKSADQRMTQDSGYGCRAALRYISSPVRPAFLSGAAWSLEGFVQYWSVDDSDRSPAGWYEPRNNSTAYGIRAGLAF